MKKFSIKEVSELLSVPSSTLRYYEEVGILNNVERNSSGQRVYNEEHIGRIKAINCFKGTGMTISMLQEFFRYEENEKEHINDILILLEEQKRNVDLKFQQLEKDMKQINRKLRHYKEVKKALEENKPIPSWEASAE